MQVDAELKNVGGSFYILIPPIWVKAHKLKHKDELTLEVNDHELIIRVKQKAKTK